MSFISCFSYLHATTERLETIRKMGRKPYEKHALLYCFFSFACS
nr:MAG TPA: hypothetical protein [Crassvirales sp.]